MSRGDSASRIMVAPGAGVRFESSSIVKLRLRTNALS